MQTDKLIHALGSYFVATVLVCFMPLMFAVGITLALGVVKEVVYDWWMGKGTPEWVDLAADLAGVTVAFIIQGGA